MQVKDLLKINQNISVSLDNGRDDWYHSKIQGVAAEVFLIDVPYAKNSPLILNKGDRVKLHIALDYGKFELKSKVTGRRVDNIPLYSLTIPDSYVRIQQRRFARLPIMIGVSYAEIPEDGKDPKYTKSHTLDISGGGLRFAANKSFPVGSLLLLKISIPTGSSSEELTVYGRVVRTITTGNAKSTQIAIEFEDISIKHQDMIAGFVLNEMARFRRGR
jgi:c-di-GMP-binding flagellar brake protein YcgR